MEQIMKTIARALSIPTHAAESRRELTAVLTAAAVMVILATPVWAQSTSPAPSGSGQPAQQPAPAQSGGTGTTSPSAGTPSGQTAQPGVRAIDPATLRMTFYTVQPADMLASNLMGLDVHNLKNEEIGEIEDLIIDNGKMLRGIVVGIGGFLGIGERRTVIEPASIVLTREANGSLKAVVNTTREDLKKAPEFKFEGAMARNKSK
jgi:sporulation protein YlmC with PRC-barrel domain